MRINVVSALDVTSFGGLETYIRNLLAKISSTDHTICLNGGNDCSIPLNAELWQSRSTRLLPLMTRRPLRRAARWLACKWGRDWAREMVAPHDVHHFVGTGWDLFGFPLVEAAMEQRKVVTCWPAVHPFTWGDAPLDIDLYKLCDSVFCQSAHESRHLQTLGVPGHVTRVLPCGSDRYPLPAEYRSEAAKGFREAFDLVDRPLILFVGKRIRSKGYHQLVDAIRRLADSGSDVVLAAIGNAPDPPCDLLPKDCFRDLGAASDEIKQAAYAACDLFVLPSEAESFGIVYVEAWSYSKPVICGTAPASRELVTTHQGGVVTDGTAGDIAAKIKLLLDYKELRLKMGSSGHDAYRRYFTPDAVANRHLSVWQGLVEERQRPLGSGN
jgi:glycosyltransferase involved in cell wall biosynthesis